MTLQQKILEKASIEVFVDKMMRKVRPHGTSAAVTLVLLEAARAAANAAVRKRSGAIDQKEATKIFQDAARLMTKKGK